MKEVLETVSEVQFRSIAVIVAVALLGMVATWWVLTGSASPTLTAEEPGRIIGSSHVPERETQKGASSLQAIPTSQQPEVYVEEGETSFRLLDTPQSLPEKAENGFVVQIGAFQQEEGALRRLKELGEQGYEARIVSFEENGTALFRVILGSFSTKEEAELAANALKTAGVEVFLRAMESD